MKYITIIKKCKHFTGIALITIILLALLLTAKVCSGDYEGDVNAVCTEPIYKVIINKVN